MINRQNYDLVMKFLAYKKDFDNSKPSTIKRDRSCLLHLLRWAGETSFSEAHTILPTFVAYLNDEVDLSKSTIKKILITTRACMRWCRENHPSRFGSQDIGSWIKSLAPKRVKIKRKRPIIRRPYKRAEIEQIASLPTSRQTLKNFRDQAGVLMLFASGMRIGALVSMPVHSVDLTRDPPEIRQWPEYGIRTKFDKAATTFLIPLPSLLSVIREWDSYVRSRLPETALWFAPLTRDGTGLRGDEASSGGYDQRMRAGLKRLCKRADIPYRRPHDLRHGHARYVRTKSRHPSTREVIQYNLMHGTEDVTDIYLEATYETARRVYAQLAPSSDRSQRKEEILRNIQRQVKLLEEL
jgi:integrase